MNIDSGPKSGFPTTLWPEIHAAATGSSPTAIQALDVILRRYQTPLKIHLLTKFGMTDERAADYLQSFIQKKILEQALLARSNQSRGRFRSFLLTALDRFVISEHRREASAKRSPGSELLSWELMVETEGLHPQIQSRPFELAWARAVLDATLHAMRDDCRQTGREILWILFEERLSKPVLHGLAPRAYKELVSALKLESPTQASNLLTTAKRLFIRHLRAVVQEYANDAAEVEAELRELRAVLACG